MKQKAICMVFSERVKSENFILLDKIEIKEFKTKKVNKVIESLEKVLENKKNKEEKRKRSVLVINEVKDEKAKYSMRNLVGVEMINIDNTNILDLLKYRNLIATKGSIRKIEERMK